MTMTGAGSPACRELRQLLGVYVVGAIDPPSAPWSTSTSMTARSAETS